MLMFSVYVYLTVALCHVSDVKAVETEGKTPDLAPNEKFLDLFPLSRSNFTTELLKSRDAWIVVFHNGSLDIQWKSMAAHLRGICWVGVVDTTTEVELLADLKVDIKTEIARVYPYGKSKHKWKTVTNQNDARTAAVASLPDKMTRISGTGVQDFVTDALMSRPSRFPVYFISDEEETPAFIKALSLRFEKYFHFGRLVKPSSTDIKHIGLGELFVSPPALFVIVFKDGNIEHINAIQFDTDRNGQLNYTNVLRFLFAINSEFRHQLPGDNRAGSQQEAEMTDIIEIEAKRFELVLPGSNWSEAEKVKNNRDSSSGEGFINQPTLMNRDEL